jgi:hypothetical protein
MIFNSFSYLLHEERQLPTNNAEPDNDEEEHNPEGDTFRDTRSESGSEAESDRFYTAMNNSVEDIALSDPGTEHFADIPESLANAPWGTPLRRYQLVLEKIYQERIAAGVSPDWPFTDYLEFEFVKWMVVNDISQTARDKLIKLPIVCFYLWFEL